MELVRGCLVILIMVSLIVVRLSNVEGRYHYHKKKQNKAYPELDSDPSPSIPSDPYPNDPGDSTTTSDCVFNVMSYGATGDGVADDTSAFRKAWKEACAVESAVVLAPSNYCFKITSSIFSGPCKPGLTFQVSTFFPRCDFFFFCFR